MSTMTCFMQINKNKPAHDKTYNRTSAISEDSDQPVHPHSLIRVFADGICLLQPQDYLNRDEREPMTYRGGCTD